MANKTLTIALNGDVPLISFIDALRHFHGLLRALQHEVGGDADVSWTIEELQSGSAIAEVRGDYPEAQVLEKIAGAYRAVGHALQANAPIPYSERVEREARAITAVLDGPITSIRFTADDDDVIISSNVRAERPMSVGAYGGVEGYVHTLTSRNKLSFTLYDVLFDRAVPCYLRVGQEEMMRGVWGKRAIVIGYVSRDPLTGRPVTIRDVSTVQVVEDVAPGAYREARGMLAKNGESPDAVAAIRLAREGMRDRWGHDA